jgi:hypothetical protein
LPSAKFSHSEESWQLDSEFTGNLWSTLTATEQQTTETKTDAEIHRLWVRLSDPKTEIRLGLQKINFGPAKILRTLQWFDQLDPRDPTKFTTGVKGSLIRHYFSDDSNFWAWVLYGNSDLLGPVPLHSDQTTPEVGGRFQIPIGSNEFALSAHHRNLNKEKLGAPQSTDDIIENRIAFDGVWDLVTGMWVEVSLSEFDGIDLLPTRVTMATLGTDYTFDLGNSLYTAIEIKGIKSSFSNSEPTETFLFAINQTYTLGLIDQINAIWVGCFDCQDTNLSIDYLRTYDRWLYSIGGFYQKSDSNNETMDSVAETNPLEGKGVKLTVQVNI